MTRTAYAGAQQMHCVHFLLPYPYLGECAVYRLSLQAICRMQMIESFRIKPSNWRAGDFSAHSVV